MVVDGDYYNSPIVQGQKTAVLFKGLNNIGMPITEIQPRTSSVDYAYMMSYSKLYNASLVEVIDQTNDRRLYLFDQETNKALHDWKSQHLGCPSTGYDLVSSPDQKYFAIITRRDNTSYQLCVFDLSTKELVINKILRDDFISYGFQINFSPDSHTVAVLASERQILFNKDRSVRFALHIINIDASKSVEFQIELPEPTPVTFAYTTKESNITVSALTFTPDSSLMAVGTYDGRILLIDTLDGSILDVIQAHVEPILSVAFNSDGSLLSSMGRSSILKFWGIAPQ
jgi:WD40 repeat protein